MGAFRHLAVAFDLLLSAHVASLHGGQSASLTFNH